MHPYAQKADSVIGAGRSMQRLSTVLGAPAPLMRSPLERPDVEDGLGTVVGAGIGAYYFKRNRVLGAIGAASLGRNLPALIHPEQRRIALANMGTTGLGLLGAQMMRKSPTERAIGFIGGYVLGNILFGSWRSW